uniref:Uncharacterized protein n=1 Tax=Lates calcarifer TaxID=8187 RepID=A0A4W6BP56_LATCA
PDGRILRKLAKKGAKKVNSPEKRDATIIFCPIVSRFETDINTALEAASSEIPECRKVIVVAMHHTFDPNYPLPNSRQTSRAVTLLVDCLFYEKKGFLVCSQNKMAVKKVCKEVITQVTHHFLYDVVFSLGNGRCCLFHQTLVSENKLGVSQVSTHCPHNYFFIYPNKIFDLLYCVWLTMPMSCKCGDRQKKKAAISANKMISREKW